ncbi:enoyl-CoA hydratase/isomerase family protein [Corynebacterium terpenotabidum]|uniref:Enoyl-CoA hydratase n=1 Tax=Corynebacterium terpenotabidum Y-11 TaxID=1200352 RepID=S4XKU7_9CORY|nr:enoyl-CoA hydratase-related protein [Corynebacterium terpenotabidum]AGP31218.1 enoyl-CoA hydratase [Corynebacterium terpenotabidum Y-11]
MSNTDIVTVADAAGVRTITLNRPEAFSSLNRELRLALIDAFTAAAADSATGGTVRAVVVAATGKAFCAGQDLREQLQDARDGTGKDKVFSEYNPMMAALLSIPVPVIAAIQGPAAGAGWGIAMACDFRVVASTASFKGAFSGVGLASDCGLSQSLTDAVGQAKALELLLFDEKITADRAAELGIVTSVVEPDALAETVAALAARFAAGPTASYREIKALVRDAAAVNARADDEGHAQVRLFTTHDHSEAMAAFLEKRAPGFTGQ